MSFEWDRKKADANLRKHGIDFADAVAVLEDELALTMEDEGDHGEERLVTVGMDALNRLLVVVWCGVDEGDSIRIISARPATKREKDDYEG